MITAVTTTETEPRTDTSDALAALVDLDGDDGYVHIVGTEEERASIAEQRAPYALCGEHLEGEANHYEDASAEPECPDCARIADGRGRR